MTHVRTVLLAIALPAFATGCLVREGNPYNVGTFPHEWVLPGPDDEILVTEPIPFEELKDFVRERESEGWEVIGYEAASLPEGVMVDKTELDRPSKTKRGPWTFDIPKTMDDGLDPPAPKLREPDGAAVDSIPPYLDEGVKTHRQRYILVLRRWL